MGCPSKWGVTAARSTRVSQVCDHDALLVQADLWGPGCCHLGYKSCFFRKPTASGGITTDEEVNALQALDMNAPLGTAMYQKVLPELFR
jgi:hypothetical protein